MPLYNLIAYTSDNTALFGRKCKNIFDAKAAIVNHGMLAHVQYVIFKGKRFSIGMIYKL